VTAARALPALPSLGELLTGLRIGISIHPVARAAIVLTALLTPETLGDDSCHNKACGLANEKSADDEGEPADGDVDKIKGNKAADDAAKEEGYKDAHDAKKGRGDSKVDIYKDRKTGRLYLWDGRSGSSKEPL
jgi:hypothetical protein